MPKYVIEREIPGVDKLSSRDKKAAAAKSLRALKDIGPDIQWIHSYVSEKQNALCLYCSR